MNNSESDSVQTELNTFIISQVQDSFNRLGSGVFLSQIGTLIAKNANLKNALGDRKLASFIEHELGGYIQIISLPENSKLKLALPANVSVKNVTNLVPKSNVSSSSSDIPRYDKTFWAAFSQPLDNDYIRYIEFEPEISFEDRPSGFSVSGEHKNITPDFVIKPTQYTDESPASRSKLIAKQIERWLTENNVDLNLVKARIIDNKAPDSHKGSLLEQLMSALDEADLKRIQIPLDVIAKLHRNR
jgi:hypothetical protein